MSFWTPEFDLFAAPARSRPALWRLFAGIVLLVVVYIACLAGIFGLIALIGGETALVYWMQRSFVAPTDLAPEAVAYYTAMFEKLNASEEWQTYTTEKSLNPDFLTGDDLQAYFVAERSKHADLLGSMNEGS